MCDKCGTDEELAEYMNEMQNAAFGAEEWNIEPIHLISAASNDGSIVIAQEVDVAVINDDGVTVDRKKNVVIIPPEKLSSLAMFLISNVARNKIEGNDDEHSG